MKRFPKLTIAFRQHLYTRAQADACAKSGESSFLSAILFLLASMIKYTPTLAKTVINLHGNQWLHYCAIMTNVAANIFFIFAVFKFMHVLLSLFQLLRLRQSDTFHVGLSEQDYKV